MNAIFGIASLVRILEVVLPLIAVLWADTIIDWYWPTWALGARTRWRNAQKRLIAPFLPLNAERTGPMWPLNPMVDTTRFLERPVVYLGRMGGFILVCTAVHYWDRMHGLTALWAMSYVVGVFVVLVMLAGLEVWGEA